MMRRGFACILSVLAISLASAQEKHAPVPPIQLLPGQVEVSFIAHEIDSSEGRIPCWTFVSKGLERYGQREIVFSLRRPPGKTIQDVAPEIYGMFDNLRVQAQRGKPVKAYDASTIAQDSPFLGQKGPWGLIFIPAQMFEGVEVPFEALAAVLIKGDEIEVVSKSSPLRIASMLGAAFKHYPCPPWSDLGRKPVVSARESAKSILNKATVTRMPGLMVKKSFGPDEANIIILRVEGAAMQRLNTYLAGLPDAGIVALMTDPDPESTMRYAWMPGSGGGIIYATAGDYVTGSFVLFLYAPGLQNSGQAAEDGIALMLNSESWKGVKDVLARGEPTAMILNKEDHILAVQFVQTFSVDNLAAPIFLPEAIVMFQSQETMEVRLGGLSLSEHAQKFEKAIQAALAGADLGDACGLMVAIGIRPGNRRAIWCEAVEGHLPEATLDGLHAAFSVIPVLEVKDGPVAFMLKGALKDRTVKAFPKFPSVWTKTLDAASQQFTDLDGLFKLIWKD